MHEKNTRRFNYKPKLCQNAALPLNVMHLNIPLTECWTLCWAILKRKCRHFDEIFITGCTGSCHFDNFQCSQWWKFHQNEDISVSVYKHLAMMARPVLTKLFKAWSIIVVFIPVYDILMSSQSRHSSFPNWHALNYWLAYTMTDTCSLMVL